MNPILIGLAGFLIVGLLTNKTASRSIWIGLIAVAFTAFMWVRN